jgi:hypothetical protein
MTSGPTPHSPLVRRRPLSREVFAANFDFRGRTITRLWTAHDPAHTLDMLGGLPAERRNPIDAWLKKYLM